MVRLTSILLLIAALLPAAPPAPRFEDRSSGSGIDMVLRNDASDRKRLIETMTGGVALLDFDNDGLLDLYVVNGAPIPQLEKPHPAWWNRLYRNLGGWKYEDVTEEAGVAGKGYAMGVAAGDFDGDGDPDLFVTGVRQNVLYRNNGDGTFTDVTAASGLAASPGQSRWAVSAGWFDADADGDLDLFVANYVNWNPATEPSCGDLLRKVPTYCHPDMYEGTPNQLFRNNGDGTFTDVSDASRIARHTGKGMGLSIADADGDGPPDVFVPNDAVPNFLFFNNGDGTFREGAFDAGVAMNDDGRALSSMGADLRDVDNDGAPDLFITALTNETWPLYRNLGERVFAEVTYPSGIGRASLPYTGWGAGVYDFNNDGWKDLFVAGGDVNTNTEKYSSRQSAQPNRLLLGENGARFHDATDVTGLDRISVAFHRGAAFADLDNDGCMDAVVTRLNQRPLLLRNHCGNAAWIGLALAQEGMNRHAIGAKVTVIPSKGPHQVNAVSVAVGYASSSDVRVHFGLGEAGAVERVLIRWPDGAQQVVEKPPVNTWVRVERAPPR